MSEPQPVEALLFDLGGVVIDIDFGEAFRIWEPLSRLSGAEFHHRFEMDACYERHERGEIDADEYFEHVRNVLELDASDDAIAEGWNAIFLGRITPTLQRILSLRQQIPCFAFTNSNPTHQAAWTADYPDVVATFERIFVSSELGLRKPERAAFDAVTQAIGVASARILFFDDTLENVHGARNANLQAVHVRAPGDVDRALADIGRRA